MTLDYFRNLARYQEWADSLFFSRWRRFPQSHENEDLKLLSNHLVRVQTLFLDAVEQLEISPPDKDHPLLPIRELQSNCQHNHRRLNTYLNPVTEAELLRPVTIPWFPADFGLTVSDAILQMVLHTQHHRAQLLQNLARYAEKSMVVDYIAWLYKGKPAGSWE